MKNYEIVNLFNKWLLDNNIERVYWIDEEIERSKFGGGIKMIYKLRYKDNISITLSYSSQNIYHTEDELIEDMRDYLNKEMLLYIFNIIKDGISGS